MGIPKKVLFRGAGDIASGVAHRLFSSGFDLVMLELPWPMVVRRSVSFAEAVFSGSAEVESARAVFCENPERAEAAIERREIPVLIDPKGDLIAHFKPTVIVDALMAKKNRVTGIADAELVIGLGPGFTAGSDVHAVIETERGHNLGRVIYEGSAAPDTGVPGIIGGYGRERLLRAPVDGIFRPLKEIGDLVSTGETVALVGETKVTAGISGLVRGLLHEGLEVTRGVKVGDIDPRGKEVDVKTVSDKARAVGGGVLEAIMHRFNYGKRG